MICTSVSSSLLASSPGNTTNIPLVNLLASLRNSTVIASAAMIIPEPIARLGERELTRTVPQVKRNEAIAEKAISNKNRNHSAQIPSFSFPRTRAARP